MNVELNDIFGRPTTIVYPNEFIKFAPQEGYFNLFTSNDGSNYTENPDCVRISPNGFLSDSITCPPGDVNYICKIG